MNHNEIVEALKAAGISILETDHVGRGFPDLIIGYNGKSVLMEIKNPAYSYGRKGFNGLQQKFADSWKGCAILIARSGEEAVRLAKEACK